MVTQRVQVPCPKCSHHLRIRVEDIGRKGECKYCGHQFRPRVKLSAASLPHGDVPGVETLEQRLEKSWARLTAKQLSVIEQLMVALGTPSAQSGVAVEPRAGAPSRLSPEGSTCTHRLPPEWTNGVEPPDEELAAHLDANDRLDLSYEDPSVPDGPACASDREGVLVVTAGKFEITGNGTDTFQFQGEIPIVASALATPPANIVECVNRLVQERDEARTHSARLLNEVSRVREELAKRLSEVARLRQSADRLKTVRAERDQLNAERTMLGREAAQLQARMVETQVALVEVGAELDECRERLSIERHEWQQQRQQLIEEAEHQLSGLRSQTGAEIDRLRAALEEAEFRECAPMNSG